MVDESLTGCESSDTKTTMLAKHISVNDSLKGLDCSRQCIDDKSGAELAQALLLNKTIRRFDSEGNKLGSWTSKQFGYVLKFNKSLQYLNLEANDLTLDQ